MISSPSSRRGAAGRSIVELPDRELPDGFTFRTASGPEDAAALAEVHAASFGSKWTDATYRRYMESPAYEASTALYRATGFEPRHAIWDYKLALA